MELGDGASGPDVPAVTRRRTSLGALPLDQAGAVQSAACIWPQFDSIGEEAVPSNSLGVAVVVPREPELECLPAVAGLVADRRAEEAAVDADGDHDLGDHLAKVSAASLQDRVVLGLEGLVEVEACLDF